MAPRTQGLADRYGARWPHLDQFLEAMRAEGHSASKMCRTLGINPVTFSLWKQQEGRCSFAALRAMVQKYGGPVWAARLRDSVVVDRNHGRGFAMPPEVHRLARIFDAQRDGWSYVVDGGGFYTPVVTDTNLAPGVLLARAPIDTAAAGGNAAPPAPDNADSQSSQAGEVSAPSGPVADPTTQVEIVPDQRLARRPLDQPFGGTTEQEVLVLLAARLIGERDRAMAQAAAANPRADELAKQLDAATIRIAEQARLIERLTAEVAEWQALAESASAPQAPAEPPREPREVIASIAQTVERAPGVAPRERQGLLEELAQLPKAQGHAA